MFPLSRECPPGRQKVANSLQKDAWTTTISILQNSTEAEAQLFAATTLKGKVWDSPSRTEREE